MGDIQLREILRSIMEKDVEFYEENLSHLSEEEFQKFLDANPEFLED